MTRLPDAESTVVAFLRDRCGVHVGTKVPNPRPARFIRAWRSGGSAVHEVLDVPHITVTAWAEDSEDASALASTAREALFNDYTAMPLVRRVEEVGGVYYDPDPATGADRYTFTMSLRIRAVT